LRQSFGGALLVLEIALPDHAVAFFQMDDLVDLPLCLGDGTAHVAATDREFDGGITAVLIAEDQAGAGLLRDVRNLVDRNLGAALCRDQQIADIRLGRAELFGEANADIEFPDAFIELGHGLTADGHLDNRVGVGGAHAIERHLALVKIDVQLGLTDILDDAEVFDAFYRLELPIHRISLRFHIVQRIAVDLDAYRAFDARYGFLDVVHDGLREIQVGAGDDRQRLAHRIDKLFLGDLRVPLFLGIQQDAEF